MPENAVSENEILLNGKYAVQQLLYAGSEFDVFLARDITVTELAALTRPDSDLVALKVLNLQSYQDPLCRDRFFQQALDYYSKRNNAEAAQSTASGAPSNFAYFDSEGVAAFTMAFDSEARYEELETPQLAEPSLIFLAPSKFNLVAPLLLTFVVFGGLIFSTIVSVEKHSSKTRPEPVIAANLPAVPNSTPVTMFFVPQADPIESLLPDDLQFQSLLGEDMWHTVQHPGESLSIVAAWYLGDLREWPKLLRANPKLDPTVLTLGQQLRIPALFISRRSPLTLEFVKERVGISPRRGSPGRP